MTKSGCHSTKLPCLDGKQNSKGGEGGRMEGDREDRNEWLIVMLLSLKRAGQVL